MILDSGERREFATGAVRDMAEGKGRFDLVPLDALIPLIRNDDSFFFYIDEYQKTGEQRPLITAASIVIQEFFATDYDAFLELSKHFENGMKKYGIDNWKKGIETKSYVDSAVRHYCKHKAGHRDEPHDVACLWNLVCGIWTIENKPELNSYAPDPTRCTETTCYYNNDCICTADKAFPELAQHCPNFMED